MGERSRELARQRDWSVIARRAIAEYERLIKLSREG
jgi:hypothetical protein